MSDHTIWLKSVVLPLCILVGVSACGRVTPSLTGGGSPAAGVQETYLVAAEDLKPLPLREGEILHVTTSMTIIRDVVANVGGEAVGATALIPVGIDPHAFEPTPQDLKAVTEADVVFVHGMGLEASMAKLFEGVAGPKIVAVSSGIVPIPLKIPSGAEGQGGVDPHTWMDPGNVVVWTENIDKALSALDPARADEYRSNAARYQEQLRGLDRYIENAVSKIPAAQRKLVTDHEELGYFAARYGFEIVGTIIPAASTLAEPSAQELAVLEDAIRTSGVRAIFTSSVVSPVLTQRVAQDTGATVVTLYVHSLSLPQGPAPTYLDLMRYNVDAIVNGLAP